MKIAFWGDSLTAGRPGSSFFNVLANKLPDHTMFNHGRGGDTVVSLHKRILSMDPLEPVDMAFVWIGTNDILLEASISLRLIGLLRRSPTTPNGTIFKTHYRSILKTLTKYANLVTAVPPVLIGEDLDNRWNQQLAELAQVIEELASQTQNVRYLDLRTAFTSRLAQKQPSSYLPLSASQIAVDSLRLKTDNQIDKVADERGLHVTLDGVHLNSAGADMVASKFMDVILSEGG